MMQETETDTNSGGAAPRQRQCTYLKSDGQKCRDWSIRGQDYCHRHDLFLHARIERPIDVPLLEDEASIVLLLSETLRALAWGTIPVPNGRMLITGCRLAHTLQCQRLEMAKFRLKVRRMGIREDEIFDPVPAEHAEPVALCAEPDSADATDEEHEPTPIVQPSSRCQFRDLKKDWDKELLRTENEQNDKYSMRHGETREDLIAARARPWDHLAEIDREVAEAVAMAKAQSEACLPA